MSTAKQAFWCTHRDGYSVIAFPAELSKADMSEVREAGVRVIEQLDSVQSPSCLVDLSALSYMGSSMVASIVKIWKTVNAKGGKMVVVAPGEKISDVLKVTGLTKVWTIVQTFEAGIHALGCSVEARVEKRERRLLTFVGPMALVGTGVAVAAKVAPRIMPLGNPPEWMIWTLAGLAVLASGVSTFREKAWRCLLSIVVLLLSLGLGGFYFWYANVRVVVPEVVVPEADEKSGSGKDKSADGKTDKAEGPVPREEGQPDSPLNLPVTPGADDAKGAGSAEPAAEGATPAATAPAQSTNSQDSKGKSSSDNGAVQPDSSGGELRKPGSLAPETPATKDPATGAESENLPPAPTPAQTDP